MKRTLLSLFLGTTISSQLFAGEISETKLVSLKNYKIYLCDKEAAPIQGFNPIYIMINVPPPVEGVGCDLITDGTNSFYVDYRYLRSILKDHNIKRSKAAKYISFSEILGSVKEVAESANSTKKIKVFSILKAI